MQDQAKLLTTKERSNSFKKATIILIIGLFLSKLTGQIREVLYGVVLQEAYLTDAYVQGFLIPDFIYELLIGGSIQAALIPALAGALGTKREKKVWRDVSTFISLFSLIMLLFIICLELFASPILSLITKPTNLELTVRVARRLFPQTFFMMGAALVIGILNAHKLFTKTALGPAIYNTLVCISLLVFGRPNEPALLLVAQGISCSALIYFVWQLLLGRKQVRPFRFNLDLARPGFKRLFWLAVPTLFSASIAQLGNIVLQAYTKTMPVGSATALRYAGTVWMLPYGIFTVAIGQVMLPSLSAYIQQQRYKAAANILSKALRLVLVFALPSALIFYFMRQDIIVGIFWWKNVAPMAAQLEIQQQYWLVLQQAAAVLAYYCVAIVCQSIIYLYNFAFYAHRITIIPLINAAISLIITIVLGYVASQQQDIASLSAAYAISSSLIACALMLIYHLKFKKIRLQGFAFFTWQNLIALLLLAVYLYFEQYIGAKLPYINKIVSLLIIGARAILAYLVYYCVCWLTGMRELMNWRYLFSKA